MAVQQAKGICVDCSATKGIQPITGKRENARCNYHHKKHKALKKAEKCVEEGTILPIVKPIKARKPINNKSAKLKREEALYAKEDKPEYMDSIGHVCEARLAGCTYHATEIHHKKGRGVYLRVQKFFLGVCRNCHDKIEGNPEWAKENGYSLNRLTKD